MPLTLWASVQQLIAAASGAEGATAHIGDYWGADAPEPRTADAGGMVESTLK